MLAVATTTQLFVADPSTLKRTPAAIPSTCEIPSPPTASVWSSDGTSLYLSSPRSILRYNLAGELVKVVHEVDEGDGPISSFVAKDKGTLIFAAGPNVHVLEHSASASATSKVVHTLTPHVSNLPIVSLSLSNDNTLLAAASTKTVLVHNLSLGSHTVLRGLPVWEGQNINVCMFHPHSRVRFFLGIGNDLVVYDITRPSGPTRVLPAKEPTSGDIVSIACSPFSKTLLAVGYSNGYVSCVDLEKDHGMIRTYSYRDAVTAVMFSTDGATLYVGTATGKVLVQSLRGQELPKAIVIGEHNHKVMTLAVAKKIKGSSDMTMRSTPVVSLKPITPQDVSSSRRTPPKPSTWGMPDRNATKPGSSPLKRSSSIGTSSTPGKLPPVRKRVSSTTAIGSKSATAALKELILVNSNIAEDAPELISRGVHDQQPQDGNLLVPISVSAVDERTIAQSSTARRGATARSAAAGASAQSIKPAEKTPPRTRTTSLTAKAAKPDVGSNASFTPRVSPRPKYSPASKSPSSLAGKAMSAAKAKEPEEPTSITSKAPRARKVSTTARTTATGTTSPSVSASSRSRTASSTSRTTSSSARTSITSSSRQRTTSAVSRNSATTARDRSPLPPNPKLPKTTTSTSGKTHLAVSARSTGALTRTPSPDFPMVSVMDEIPPFSMGDTPAKGKTKRKGLSVFGLGTPEVERWIEGNDAAGVQEKFDGKLASGEIDEEEENFGPIARPGLEELMEGRGKSKPRERPLSMQVTPRRPSAQAWAASPLRHSVAGGSPGSQGATMLHSLIRDAMLDFREDTKAEIVGLHLDLVRMGRAWRQEMRAAMEEYVGDLRELREENKKLREENERLRRGF